MNEFLKMDIFFVIATLATIGLAVMLGIAFFYLARFIKTLDRIANSVEEEAGEIRKDIDEARRSIKQDGARVNSLISFFGKTATRYMGSVRGKKRKTTK